MSRPPKSEKSERILIRVPASWHSTLIELSQATGQDMSVLIRPYIQYGINDLKMKMQNNQIVS